MSGRCDKASKQFAPMATNRTIQVSWVNQIKNNGHIWAKLALLGFTKPCEKDNMFSHPSDSTLSNKVVTHKEKNLTSTRADTDESPLKRVIIFGPNTTKSRPSHATVWCSNLPQQSAQLITLAASTFLFVTTLLSVSAGEAASDKEISLDCAHA